MSSVSIICDRIGRKKIEQKLGVGKSSISNAVSDGMFPASWYLVIKGLADADGIECPESVFNFKDPSPLAPCDGVLCRAAHGGVQ